MMSTNKRDGLSAYKIMTSVKNIVNESSLLINWDNKLFVELMAFKT